MYLIDHLEKLRYFYEIASLGSMQKAAESIFITQPSLTKSIKILESAVGKDLFIRKPRGVELTTEGEILFEYCHNLFANLSDLERKLESPDDPFAGSIRVGTYDSIGIYFWPKFLKKLLPKYPKLNIEMKTGRSGEIQKLLEKGELDLALIVEPKEGPSVEKVSLIKDSFKFYAAEKKSRTMYQKEEDIPLILMPEAIAGNVSLKEALLSLGLADKRLYTTSSLESVKEMTISGIGVGLLPEMVAKDALKTKKIKEYPLLKKSKSEIGKHEIGIAYHQNASNSPLVSLLIDEIKSSLN